MGLEGGAKTEMGRWEGPVRVVAGSGSEGEVGGGGELGVWVSVGLEGGVEGEVVENGGSVGEGGEWVVESFEGIAGCEGSGRDSLWATLPAWAPCELPSCCTSTDLKYCSISPMASSNGVSDVLKLSRSSMPPLLNPSWASVFWRSVNEDSSLPMTCNTGVS